jgi:hypothetical protein
VFPAQNRLAEFSTVAEAYMKQYFLLELQLSVTAAVNETIRNARAGGGVLHNACCDYLLRRWPVWNEWLRTEMKKLEANQSADLCDLGNVGPAEVP